MLNRLFIFVFTHIALVGFIAGVSFGTSSSLDANTASVKTSFIVSMQ